MSVESVEELLFWQENLSGLNSSPLRQSMAAVRVDIKMAGDASAAGVFLGNFTRGNTLLSLPFTEEQIKKSSTWRELFVLYTFYCSKEAEKYRGETVLHLCDKLLSVPSSRKVHRRRNWRRWQGRFSWLAES